MTINHIAFSYETLSLEVAAHLNETANAIRGSIANQFEEVLAIGGALVAAKESLPHGMFGKWVALEFKWSERTATNYMQVARTFSENPQRVADLPLRIVYQLSAPSLPANVREAVLKDAGAAGAGDERQIASLISQHMAEHKAAIAEAAKTNEQRLKEKRAHEHRERANARAKIDWDARNAEEAKAEAEAERIALLIIQRCPDLVPQIIEVLGTGTYRLAPALTKMMKESRP